MKWYAHILALVEIMGYVRDKFSAYIIIIMNTHVYFHNVISSFDYNGYNIVNAAQVM